MCTEGDSDLVIGSNERYWREGVPFDTFGQICHRKLALFGQNDQKQQNMCLFCPELLNGRS